MIHLDAIGFKFLADEINEKVMNSRINKVISYDELSFSIISNKNIIYFEKKKEAILFLKNQKTQNTNYESSFVQKLKKYLIGSIIRKVYTKENDRIIIMDIEKLTFLGKLEQYKLIYEFLGKSINVLLIDSDNMILASMFVNMNMERKLLANSNYVFPKEVKAYGKYMLSLDEEKRKEYSKSYEAIIYDNNILTYNNFLDGEYKLYTSLNEAINVYFSNNHDISIIDDKKKRILKEIKSNQKRLEKILLKIDEDIEKNKGYEEYKNKADLLTANIYKIKNRMDKIELLDYNTNENKIIELDTKLSPSQNIKIYYDTYSKLKRKEKILTERIENVKKDLSYYSELEFFLENEKDLLGIEQIAKELDIDSKIKSTRNSKRELNIIEYKDAKIYIGRNNIENDKITFEIASPNDYWFHVKDRPGAHIIVKTKELTEDIIIYVAKQATKYSKLNEAIVDYCYKKNVKKIAGAKKGQVTYKNYKSIKVVLSPILKN